MTSASARLHPRDPVRGRAAEESTRIDTDAALEALDDPDCRELLEATADEALTAGELVEACDVPRSTTYRKVEQLVEAGLLEEAVRISPDGKHASEYRRAVEDVVVSISASGEVEVSHPGA